MDLVSRLKENGAEMIFEEENGENFSVVKKCIKITDSRSTMNPKKKKYKKKITCTRIYKRIAESKMQSEMFKNSQRKRHCFKSNSQDWQQTSQQK